MELSQALQRIVDLSKAGDEVRFVKPPCGPSDQFYLCDPRGAPVLVTAEPSPRRVRCTSIDGFVQAVDRLHKGIDGEVVVYAGDGEIVAQMNAFGDRRDLVSMALTPTEQHQAIAALVQKQIEQDELVWLLRSTLSGCCTHPQFATMVRKLKIKVDEGGERTVGVGRESIGMSVTREMSGIEGDLPETVEFAVPVYEEVFDYAKVGTRHTETVELAVRVDLSSRAFVFRATGSSLLDARLNARRQAVQQLREKLGGVATVLEESRS